MRFGVIQRERPKHTHRHGDVVFFRQPCRHHERFWTVVICLLVMVGQAIGLDRLAGSGEPAFSQWIGPLGTSMFIPLMFINFALVMPQRSLLITPRGVCVASTFRCRRRWMLWDAVTAVTPSLHMIRSKTGRPLPLIVAQLPKPLRRERHAELKRHLAPHFDLAQPTVYAKRLAKTRQRWTAAWFVDRLALLGMAGIFIGAQLGQCFCQSHPAIAWSLLAVFIVVWFPWIFGHTRRMERDNWIPKRQTPEAAKVT